MSISLTKLEAKNGRNNGLRTTMVDTMSNKIKSLEQIHPDIWNIDSMPLINKVAMESMFERYSDISFKKFMLVGWLHYFGLSIIRQRMLGEDDSAQSFTTIDALDGMTARWPNHKWNRRYMDRCFKEFLASGMIEKKKKSADDKRLKHFTVSEDFITYICDFYIEICETANIISTHRTHQNLHAHTKHLTEKIERASRAGSNTTLDYVRDRAAPQAIHKDRFKTTSAIAASSKAQEKSIR